MSMELDNSFTVPVPPDRAWDVLLDVERIAPCMPGATVEEFDGEVVTGRIKVKVGPVSLTYRGTAKFIERDPGNQVVVVEASGKETRGAGTASATVRASLEPEPSGDSTRVIMHTTMNVTGRPAQFGRGVMVEVGGKLVDKFAENLAQQITDDNGTGAAGTGSGPATPGADGPDGVSPDGAVAAVTAEIGTQSASPEGAGVGQVTTAPASGSVAAPVAARPPASAAPPAQASEDSLNLLRLVGPALLKRIIPIAVAAAAVTLLGRRFLRRGARGQKA